MFIVKENRTFDSMFGAFPGADGATSGPICGSDGQTIGSVPLKPAKDQALAPDHSFLSGIEAVNGGRMNCFNRIANGGPPDFRGYVQYSSTHIPAYWSYAHHFVLADHFFSSAYGPTGVEALWTFAAQSDRFVGHEGAGQYGSGSPREYCGDPAERASSLPQFTAAQVAALNKLEQSYTTAPQILHYYIDRWPCIDIKVLPDELRARHISRGRSTEATTRSSSPSG